jgi:transcriptional regulator NrdR family protein
VKSTVIGKLVLAELKKFDKMAYLRFAMVYKKINDPQMLKQELQAIQKV